MFQCNKCGLYYLETFLPNENEYASDYFLTEYKQQYGRTYEEDREKIRALAVPRLNVLLSFLSSTCCTPVIKTFVLHYILTYPSISLFSFRII